MQDDIDQPLKGIKADDIWCISHKVGEGVDVIVVCLAIVLADQVPGGRIGLDAEKIESILDLVSKLGGLEGL